MSLLNTGRARAGTRVSAVPHSWLGILIGLVLVAVGAAVSLFLILRYLDNRPLDLFDHTAQLIIVVEDALIANDIPIANLSVSEPVVRQDAGASWYWFDLDVTVPASVGLERVEASLKDVMALNDVETSNASGAESEGFRTLLLSTRGREFADIRFVVLKSEPTTEEPPVSPTNPDSDASQAPPLPPVLLPHVAAGADAYGIDALLNLALPDIEELPLDSHGLDSSDMGPLPSEKKPDETVAAPRIAIIVDDGGYGGAVTEDVLALDPSLTLAILPHATHSEETARRAAEAGFEVLLHMPMENSSDKKPFPGHIATNMTAEEIKDLTEKALEQVPNAVGVNNHEGSKFTANADAMRRFFDVIKPLGLFFVDSRTIGSTLAAATAREMGIRTASRDVFLDHDSSTDAIRGQLEQLVKAAKERGFAIGICHFRSNTAAVLAEFLPTLKAEGVTLAHVSELVK